VWTVQDQVAAGDSVDVAGWQGEFDALMARIAGRFVRVESRRRARSLVMGLLADLPSKNCWSLAEFAGDASPCGMQDLVARASWDAEGMLDDVREYVCEHLGDPDGILVVDETGDLKKGHHSVGVQRQYTGTAGRIENAQVAVFLGYASPRGHALIDRALYVPKSWMDDPDRCRAAGIPDELEFATKPRLASQLICRALDAGVDARWVTADEVYGANPGLRGELEARGLGYVLAVACDHRVTTQAGTSRADEWARRLPRRAWQRLSAGAGAKGHRFYDWAWITIDPDQPGCRWLLIRRNRRTGELAFYRCYAPHRVGLAALVRVAGRRWTIEENFQSSKGKIGLDQHQFRRWTSWHRWMTLVICAHAFLAALTATTRARSSTSDDLIPLTLNEISHLIGRLTRTPAHRPGHILHWSRWRRRHQHRARHAHYQRQQTYEL
jgi:SRSO17 transposase